jgi:hypothetical protein
MLLSYHERHRASSSFSVKATATVRLAILLATDQAILAAAVAKATVKKVLRGQAPISVVACPSSVAVQTSHVLDSSSHPTRCCTPSVPEAWLLRIG